MAKLGENLPKFAASLVIIAPKFDPRASKLKRHPKTSKLSPEGAQEASVGSPRAVQEQFENIKAKTSKLLDSTALFEVLGGPR